MTFIYIGIGFLVSIAFTLLLRRLDRTEMRMSQMKRLGDIQIEKLREAASTYIKEIQDSSLEFEVAVRKSKLSEESMKSELETFHQKTEELKEDREIIDNISRELSAIAGNASTVSEQVERLDMGLTRLGYAQKEISEIQNRIEGIDASINDRVKDAERGMSDIVARMIRETEMKTSDFLAEAGEAVQSLKNENVQLGESIQEKNLETENISTHISSLEKDLNDRWEFESNRFDEKFQTHERSYKERLHSLDSGLSTVRTAALESSQSEIARMRAELDDFNLEALSRRDEIISETRRMAEGIGDKIEIFNEKYLDAENRLANRAEENGTFMQQKMESFKLEWESISTKQLSGLEERTVALTTEIESLRREKVIGLERELEKSLMQADKHMDVFVSEKIETIRARVVEEEKELESFKEEIHSLRSEFRLAGEKFGLQFEEMNNFQVDVDKEMRRRKDEMNELRNDVMEDISSLVEKTQNKEDQTIRSLHEFVDEKLIVIKDSGSKAVDEVQEQARDLLQQLEKDFQKFSESYEEQAEGIQEEQEEELRLISEKATRLISDQNQRLDKLNDTLEEKISHQIATRTEEAKRVKSEFFADLDEEQARLEDFKKDFAYISRAEELVVKLDETVEILSGRLEMAEEENRRMDEYVRNFEDLRFSRKEIENELKMIETQRTRLERAEKGLEEGEVHIETLHEKFLELQATEKKAEQLEERIAAISSYRDDLDTFYKDLGDKRTFMENAVRYIEKARKQAVAAGENAEQLNSRVERAEMRQNELDENITEMESRSTVLDRLNTEIQRVEVRFEQMDGLLIDLQEKQKQIGAMVRKTDDMRNDGNELREDMESLMSEADEKMERLGAFFHTIDRFTESHGVEVNDSESTTDTARAGSVRNANRPANELSDLKRNGILSLYVNHKWDPELIAERMKVDPALVRAVISGHVEKSGSHN